MAAASKYYVSVGREGAENGVCFGTPNPYNVSEKYWRHTSNLYRNTPQFVTLCLAGF